MQPAGFVFVVGITAQRVHPSAAVAPESRGKPAANDAIARAFERDKTDPAHKVSGKSAVGAAGYEYGSARAVAGCRHRKQEPSARVEGVEPGL